MAGTAVVSYTYAEKNGNLTKMTYANGDYIRYEYDSQDRLVKEYYYSAATKKEQTLRTYVYDKDSNLYRMIDAVSGKNYAMYYDFLGRLMRVRDEKGNRYQYTYDAENNMTALRHEADGTYTNISYTYDQDSHESSTKIGSVSRNTAYDAWGRVSGQDWKTSTATLFHVGYEYPDSGRNRPSRSDFSWR